MRGRKGAQLIAYALLPCVLIGLLLVLEHCVR